MRRLLCLSLLFLVPALHAADPTRVRPEGQPSDDKRLGPPVEIYKSYFPFTPPKSQEEWAARRQAVREQILVATGLWPMPEKTPLNPVIHGQIDRDGYTIEKVFFASRPGHYVSGNLYRPKGKEGKRPGVLFAHGHWANGRLYQAPEKSAQADLASKGEGTIESARYPLQALPAMLARLGCVVFVYDMVGVADSKAIPHAAGFADAAAELRLQSAMGLQTWNSLRALDFLTGLPDVDPQRIGMTGASGGGTQTFILCAIDDRPAVAFPAVMVSTAMQGGCVCENCSYLRIGTGNVEIAGLFAPKPLGMTGANDWTKEIETKGLPELKSLYHLLGADANVMAKCFPQFSHNYNQMSREVMYDWMNEHLHLGHKGPIHEKPFVPVTPQELSVHEAEHPVPKDALSADRLRQLMAEESDKQIEALFPKDATALAEYRRVVGPALRVMVGDYPSKDQIVLYAGPTEAEVGGYAAHKAVFGRKDEGDRIPSLGLIPPRAGDTLAIWVHPNGKASLLDGDKPSAAAQMLLDRKIPVMAIDMLQAGEQAGTKRAVDAKFAGYTFGYNRPLLAEQARDIVTAVALAKEKIRAKRVYLIGWGSAGPATALAKAVCGDAVARAAMDLDEFRFDKITKTDDPMMLPGAVKYGGLSAFMALCAPGEVFFHNHAGTSSGKITRAAYAAAGAEDKLKRQPRPAKPEEVVEWITR
ncbi:MAG: alpha/beta hydrolase [Gemmataceae bacterium]